jgi:hypothetical protein
MRCSGFYGVFVLLAVSAEPAETVVADRSPEDSSGPGEARSNGSVNSGQGAAVSTASTAPTSSPSDALPANTRFEFEGTWLIGWAGGLRHFSWARFKRGAPGQVQVLDGRDLQSNEPYWSCNGVGTWSKSPDSARIQVSLPPPCSPETLELLSFSASPLAGAKGEARLRTSRLTTGLRGVQFVDTQCNTSMTSCTSPF